MLRQSLGIGGKDAPTRRCRGRLIDFIGWMLFIGWASVSFFLRPFPDGVESVGIGSIVIAIGLLRFVFGFSISAFWIIIGLVFIACGAGELMNINYPFFATALIVCGILMLAHRKVQRF